MPYETVRYEVDESILTITLNRPDKLNAFTTQMLHEMIDAFDRADKDDAVRAVIVTGAGRAFCAGADLSGGGATFDRASRTARRFHWARTVSRISQATPRATAVDGWRCAFLRV